MGKVETFLAGLVWVAVAVLLPMAALEPVSLASSRAGAAPAFALGACDDGSAHLAMGCASVSL